jgi:lysine-specific demethylase 8
MAAYPSIGATNQLAFNSLFTSDWLLGKERADRMRPDRWNGIHDRLLAKTRAWKDGRVHQVDRVRNLSLEEFRDRYFTTGIPVVFEGAAADWPAIKKWSPDYLMQFCGNDEVDVLDGQHWTVSRNDTTVVSTAESRLRVRDLMETVKNGGAWYGAFLELLDKYADLRNDLDLSFVERYGHTRRTLPWQRNILAKMYVGGPGTATSFHCAGVSNLYLQAYGRKKWVLVAPEQTPFMYPAPQRGINWQSRVDFRDPDYNACPLYRLVDRHETILEPGDILWNPPFVWHGVANVTESIAVSLWWINVTRGFANNFLYSALTLMGRPNPIAMQLGIGGQKAGTKSAFAVHLNQ